MQDCEGKKSGGEAAPAAAISTLFTSFKPRQVILNSFSNNMKLDRKNGTKTLISLSAQQRKLLLQSICQFFELNGFSKSLKKFHKEADIEKESWKSCLLNLEEMCYQFLKLRDDAKVSDCAINEKATIQQDGSINCVVSVEKENEGEKSEVDNHPVGVQNKKKKKSKSASVSSAQIAEETHPKPSENSEDVTLSVSEPEKKSKYKKQKHKNEPQEEKKEDKLAEQPAGETSDKPDASEEEKKEKSKSKKKKEDTLNTNGSTVETTEVDKEKKNSKKRKKSSSDENETGCVDEAAVDDSKRRKTENLDKSNGTILPKTPNGSANGVLENGEKKESQKKDKTRQLNGSAEPRTSANAFRRVKEEEVEFVDERLQDNSYWAKDGADSGYGAKAQEVLGQVRGRDFRHEKTKKKRGSYRGGQIDLDSHSIKFNYDDEE